MARLFLRRECVEASLDRCALLLVSIATEDRGEGTPRVRYCGSRLVPRGVLLLSRRARKRIDGREAAMSCWWLVSSRSAGDGGKNRPRGDRGNPGTSAFAQQGTEEAAPIGSSHQPPRTRYAGGGKSTWVKGPSPAGSGCGLKCFTVMSERSVELVPSRAKARREPGLRIFYYGTARHSKKKSQACDISSHR